MTIIGKTYFTYLKSRKTKILSTNCNMSCKTGSMQNSKPTTCKRTVGEEISNKNQAESRLHSQPHRLLVEAIFHTGKQGQHSLALYLSNFPHTCVISHTYKPFVKFLNHFQHSKAVSKILNPFTTHPRHI